MPVGLNRSEANSTTNPRLVFVHRAAGSGFLSDPFSLSWRIIRLRDMVEILSSTVVNLVTSKLSTGRFAPPWTPAADQAYGGYEIRWSYVSASGGATKIAAERFEILHTDILSATWRGAVTTHELIEFEAAVSSPTDADIKLYQIGLDRVRERIEEYTGRRFDPMYETRYYDVPASVPAVRTGSDAIVAVESVAFEDRNDSTNTTSVSNTDVVVYNRHLDGLLIPDDRADPRLESRFFLPPGVRSDRSHLDRSFVYPEGRQNVKVVGVFGYRDPDATHPTGRLPAGIVHAAVALASREKNKLTDPDTLRSYLGRYMRPYHVGSV